MTITTPSDLQLVMGATRRSRAINQPGESSLLALSISGSPFLRVYNLKTNTFLSNPATLPTGNGDGVDFLPNNRLVTTFDTFYSIYRMNPTSPNLTLIAGPTSDRASQKNEVRASKDGTLFAISERQGGADRVAVSVYNSTTLVRISPNIVIPSIAYTPNAVAINPNKSLFATGGGAPTSSIFLSGSFITAATTAHGTTVFSNDFSPDGLFYAETSGVTNLFSTTGFGLQSTAAFSGNGCRFNPKNTMLAVVGAVSPRIRIYSATDLNTLITSITPAATQQCCAFSRQGGFFATGDNAGLVRLYRVRGFQFSLLFSFASGGSVVNHLNFN